MALTTDARGFRIDPDRRLAQLSWMIGEGAMIYLYYEEAAQGMPYRLLRLGLLLCEQLLVSSTQQGNNTINSSRNASSKGDPCRLSGSNTDLSAIE
jgi:hypothetical protein